MSMVTDHGHCRAPLFAVQADAQIHNRFRPFELQQRPIAQFILTASGGLLGEVSRLLTKAAEAAIYTGAEQVSLELLEKAAHGRR